MSDQHDSVGETLRAAREAKGLSIEDAANRLRLMQRQIEAMESEDFPALGRPVFARGFVRNYARLLGLDHDALLAKMTDASDAPPEAVPTLSPVEVNPWFASPWVMAAVLAFLVLIVIPVGLYLWLNGGEPGAIATHHSATLAQSARPALPAQSAIPATKPAAKPLAVPAQDVTAKADEPQPVAEPRIIAAEVPAGSKGEIHFEFGADAWVEVRDASGRTLLRKLNPAGSSIDLAGEPPFDLVVGNAAQVRMSYNGRPLDLKPYIDISVARFSLEE